MKKSPRQTQGNQVADTRKYSTLRPYLLASKQASQFSLLAFSFHRVENLLRNLILHFTLTLYLACFIWNEKTINEKWSLHLSCFFDSCLLTHSFAAHRHFSPKNSDHGYR
tara:strand:+ start:161 stop:490 length:330 start_codon:yes stop_codon:yes gene_type:complete